MQTVRRGASVSREVASTCRLNDRCQMTKIFVFIRVHPEEARDTTNTENVVESKIVRLSIALHRFHMLTYEYTCQRA
jgi:hypothetical protein